MRQRHLTRIPESHHLYDYMYTQNKYSNHLEINNSNVNFERTYLHALSSRNTINVFELKKERAQFQFTISAKKNAVDNIQKQINREHKKKNHFFLQTLSSC